VRAGVACVRTCVWCDRPSPNATHGPPHADEQVDGVWNKYRDDENHNVCGRGLMGEGDKGVV
jgi:organic radical activating enzyme